MIESGDPDAEVMLNVQQ
jgi:hypothetical protein